MSRIRTLLNFNALTFEQKFTLTVTIISSIATTVVFVVYGFLTTQSYLTLTISVTLSLISDRVTRYIFENKTMKDLTDIQKQEGDLHFKGGLADGMEHFISNCSGATFAYNTVFNRTIEGRSKWLSEKTDHFNATIKKLIDAGCEWTDIYASTQHGKISNFYGNLSDDQKARYRAYQVETNLPMLDTLCVDFRGSRSFVLVGWSFAGLPQAHRPRVFLSEQSDTVNYFNEYCSKLEKEGTLMFGTPLEPTARALAIDSQPKP